MYDLHTDLIKSLEVLHFQERLALAWCSGRPFNEQGKSLAVKEGEGGERNSLQIDQIRAVVDHVIQNGFLRCQQNFILMWTAASASADGFRPDDRERIKNQLRMCIKSKKITALNTLDQLKFDCFFKNI